jgi:hypothetical protein
MPQSKNVLRRVRVKKTVKVDFKTPLGRYIRRVYGDNAAVEAQDSLDEIQDLRAQMASFCVLPCAHRVKIDRCFKIQSIEAQVDRNGSAGVYFKMMVHANAIKSSTYPSW